MPISRKEFEDGNFTILRGKAFEVLEFLKSNKDSAYLTKEIAEKMKVTPAAITNLMKRLVNDGLVEKKTPYYILAKGDKKVVKEEPKKKMKSASEPEPEPFNEEEFEKEEPEPYIPQ